MELMHGLLISHGCGANRRLSSSCGSQAHKPGCAQQELQPASDGSRQSLCPAKFSALTWLSQSQTVVIVTPWLNTSTLHVPLAHVLHPTVPPFAAQVAAAAAFGWQKGLSAKQFPLQHPAHE